MIFLVIILYLVGLIAYSSTLKKSIDAQQEIIDNAYRVLSYSDQLIYSVQQAQDVLNLYMVNPRKVYRDQYDSISGDISRQILTIQNIATEKEQSVQLEDIDSLLQEKNRIITRLLGQFRSQNPIVKLDQKIETYDDIIQDSIVITTNQDTVIVQTPQQRSFWGRLRQLFDPEKQPDTVISITRTEQEAHATSRVDTVRYTDLKNITREASESYATQITRIEQQVRELVLAEQQISLRISQLISQFYNEAIETTRNATNNSERLTRKIIGFAITVGMLSVLLILVIIFLITDDLNKGQKARVDLAREKQHTEELIESRHRLLLSVSHDIKTPLSSMMGYMEIWYGDERQPQKRQQLRSAQNSGRHILSMLNNLLEFSRLEQHLDRLQMSRFNLVELMQDIISMFQPLTDEKEVELRFRSDIPTPFFIETDETVLRQILINVISNAVKYTLNGYIEVHLQYHNQLHFTITDTGVGIDQGDISKIFKPFSRVNNPLKTEGSGFGLYVTKGLVNALKGVIQLTSEKEIGTQVTLNLPIQQAVERTPLKEQDKNRLTSGMSSRVHNIIIFEDDPSLGKMIKEFILRQGYKVELCGTPRDVHHFLGVVSSFDLAFTDMHMTGISGKDILHEIRKTGSNIPVWLMTAHADYTTEKALEDGFSGLIMKPISMSGLKAIIEDTHPPLSKRFPRLSAMFDHDTTAMKDILKGFVETSGKDMSALRKLIQEGEFAEAQSLCHRVHPFFVQLNAESMCEPLRKMDRLRGHDESMYPHWKEELAEAIERIEQFRESIQLDVQSC